MNPASTAPHLLYVEDDETLSFVTMDNLEKAGYRVTHFSNGKDALDAIHSLSFDLAVLDIMLPQLDGFALASEIRKHSQQLPILFLSAKSLKEDRLKGFELGADDYITKPFSIEELIYKIQVFLRRRTVVGPDRRSQFRFGSFDFDHKNLLLKHPTTSRTLTQKEADVLKLLLEQENQICERSVILRRIWGEDDYFMGRSLDVFISRLRKYVAPDPLVSIENVHGVGFKLTIAAT